MQPLIAILVVLTVVAILFEVARRIGVPYPTLFVVGGLALGFIPGLPRVELAPELILLVFLPPLLFAAAFETPLRDLKANLAPLLRLSIGLVAVTIVAVALVTQAVVPGLSLAAAVTLGAIVAPTDALAATSVFRRLGVPRIAQTLIEGEGLLNDATALVVYRSAVAAVMGGAATVAVLVPSDLVGGFIVAVIGGVLVGVVVGWLGAELLHRLDDPPVEVVVGLVIPFVAYLPAEELGLSGVLAVVAAGLLIGRRLGTILTANSRLLWLTSWKMVIFVINGFVFVLIGLQLPAILQGLSTRPIGQLAVPIVAVTAVVIAVRFGWNFLASLLPNSPRRVVAQRDPALAWRLVILVDWSGLRGAVSLAAALALPMGFPERDLILLVTFSVILVTLVGGGLTLPLVLRWVRWDGIEPEGDEPTRARVAAYAAGLAELERTRPDWPTHQPLFERLESGLRDRTSHLASEDPIETEERHQEHREHEEIQLGIIGAQRRAVIEMRDRGEINDATLRQIERELDLEELRMEA